MNCISFPSRSTTALWAILVLFGSGCGHAILTGTSEGVIEYAMSFPELDPNGLMADMLPNKTVLSFNKDHQSLDLSAGMGVFKTSMVVNTPEKVLNYHMSVMGKNLMAVLHPRDLAGLNPGEPPVTVVYTGAMDTIAGYPCKQAYLVYEGMDKPEEEVWYTEEIPINTPNWFGPYSEVPGVLMRYDMVQHNIRMHLVATSVKPCKVDDSKFAPHPGHQQVNPEVLNQQMDEVLGAFGN